MEPSKRLERLFELSNKRATGNIEAHKSLEINILRKQIIPLSRPRYGFEFGMVPPPHRGAPGSRLLENRQRPAVQGLGTIVGEDELDQQRPKRPNRE